jgi:hypothetical protein
MEKYEIIIFSSFDMTKNYMLLLINVPFIIFVE